MYRPRLYGKTWPKLVELIQELSPQVAYEMLAGGKLSFDSKNNVLESDGAGIKNLDELIAFSKTNTDKWDVERHIINKWPTTAKNADGELVQKANWQVKAWLRLKGIDKPDKSWTDKWLDNFIKSINKPIPKPIIRPAEGGTVVVVIADTHIGAFTKDMKLVEDYNVDKCKESLDKIAEYVNTKYPDKEVVVFHLGDVIESFTGANKPETWKHIELHGAKVALTAYDILDRFFSSLIHFKRCYFLGGNHDRITDSKDNDNEAQVVELLHGFFQRFGRWETHFDPLIVSTNIDNIQYILGHGDNRITKQDPSRIILDYGDPNYFNCIISAHEHNRRLVHDAKNFRQIVAPPIVTGNAYEQRNGWNSHPGFLCIENFNNVPLITDIPL